MAVVQNPITGRSRNKFSNAIFSTWKGKNVLRSKPLTVANPDTDAQREQRMKLTTIVALYRNTSAAVKLGFRSQAVGMSEYNAFASTNMKGAFSNPSPGVVKVEPLDLEFAKGSIAPTSLSNIDKVAQDVQVTFDSAPQGGGQSVNDELVLVVMGVPESDDEGKAVVYLTGVKRSVGDATVDLNNVFEGDAFYVYAFFVSPDGSKASDSLAYYYE